MGLLTIGVGVLFLQARPSVFGAARRPGFVEARAETADQHLWPVFESKPFNLGVVDQAVGINAVLDGVEKLAGNIDLGAVGQVAAVRQAHAKDRVAGRQ